MLADYPLNSRVSVDIIGVIPPGLRGRVGGKQRALIRRREISWSEPLPNEAYVGQTCQAVVIGYNPGYDELELSLRLIERDPWDMVPEHYPVGEEIVGRVIGLTEKGAFVEIEPGVEGFLYLADLIFVETGAIEDWLWIDDRVRALITRLDPLRRRLRLSVQELAQRRETAVEKHWWTAAQGDAPGSATIAELLPPQVRLKLLRWEDKAIPSGPRLRVLLVEDDETYAAGLERLLRRNGCQVTQAPNDTQALNDIHESASPFELIMIDWSLPGLHGDELVHQLEQVSPTSRLALIFEAESMDVEPEIQDALHESGIDLFNKSDGEVFAGSLVATLREIRAAQSHAPSRCTLPIPLWTTRPVEPSTSDTRGEMSMLPPDRQPNLAAILEQLAQNNGADTSLLLRYNPGRRHLEVITAVGNSFPLEQAPPDLIFSPLKDILQEGVEVCDRATPHSRKFKRLLDIAPFQGFLGVPIPPFGHDRYGLIQLKERGSFGHQERLESRQAAYLIGSMLQEGHLSQSLLPWQAQYMVGRLVNSAIHEINNKLGAIEFLVQDIQEGLQELARWPEKAQDASFMHDLQQTAERIAAARAGASALRDQYLSLTAGDEMQSIDLYDLAKKVVQVLRAEAQQHNVLLAVTRVSDLPPTYARPSQLRQVFLNLILNAIQQMSGLRRHGKIEIVCSYLQEARTLQVRFIDQGPGIHRQIWEHIFDFGFTTKKGGAGLGLTISRQVAASLAGRLYVEDSFMLWGTTFLLELPVGGA